MLGRPVQLRWLGQMLPFDRCKRSDPDVKYKDSSFIAVFIAKRTK